MDHTPASVPRSSFKWIWTQIWSFWLYETYSLSEPWTLWTISVQIHSFCQRTFAFDLLNLLVSPLLRVQSHSQILTDMAVWPCHLLRTIPRSGMLYIIKKNMMTQNRKISLTPECPINRGCVDAAVVQLCVISKEVTASITVTPRYNLCLV